jgi:hypothetical protein
VSQTLLHGTAANVVHTTVPFSYGIVTSTGPTGGFTVPESGIYKIIPSIQFLTTTGNGGLAMWIKVNGSNSADTSTFLATKNNEQGVLTTEYLLDLLASDQVQVWALATAHDVVLTYIASGGTPPNDYPAAPGVITNMYRIR